MNGLLAGVLFFFFLFSKNVRKFPDNDVPPAHSGLKYINNSYFRNSMPHKNKDAWEIVIHIYIDSIWKGDHHGIKMP